ncbi:MAG TPA: FixH family protein [Blastocatellia bacterium]|nr:FixH family protein [Blastocatellia bacterium]
MTAKLVVSLVIIAAFITASCSAPSGEETIKSTRSGDLTIALTSAKGTLKIGDNEFLIRFSDSSGKPVDVGAASLAFQMAAMGTMPEMNSKATLTTTDVPGQYRATAGIEMSGTWEAVVSYEGQHGTGQVRMTVNVK